MKYFSVVIGVLLAWVMVVCTQAAVAQDGAEVLVKRTYVISGVDQLSVAGGGVMEVVLGDEERLEITAPQQVLERIKVDAKGGELRIRSKAKWWNMSEYNKLQESTRYRLVLKRLQRLNVAGVLKVEVPSAITVNDFALNAAGPVVVRLAALNSLGVFDLNVSGPGEVFVAQLGAKGLNVNISGPGKAELAGEVARADVNMSGPSELYASQLMIKEAGVHLSGPSEAKMWVVDALKAYLSGPAELAYYGNAQAETKTSGPSDVTYLGLEPDKYSVPSVLHNNP